MAEDLERLTPACRVSLDGKRLVEASEAALARVSVDLDADLFAECALVFNDPRLLLINGADFASGTPMKVELGFATQRKAVFEGEVVALEPQFRRDRPPALRVVCQETMHRLALSSMTRAFNDADDRQIVSAIAKEHGLSAECAAGTPRHVLQSNVTDAAFLRRMAQPFGNHARIVGKKLIVGPPPKGAQIEIGPGSGVTKLTLRIDARRQVGEISVHGWDAAQKREVLGRAKPQGDIGEGGQKHGGRAVLSFAGHEGAPVDPATAEAMAAGRLRRIAEGFAVARVDMIGNPLLVPGAQVTFDKLGAQIDGTYRVERALHEFSKHGYYVRLRCVRIAKKKPAPPAAAAAAGAAEKRESAAGQVEAAGQLSVPRWTRTRHDHGDEAELSVSAEGLDGKTVEFAVERHDGDGGWKLLGKVRGQVAGGVAKTTFPLSHEPSPATGTPPALEAAHWTTPPEEPGDLAQIEVKAPDGTLVRFVLEKLADQGGWQEVGEARATAAAGLARAQFATGATWTGQIRFRAEAIEAGLNHLRFRAKVVKDD